MVYINIYVVAVSAIEALREIKKFVPSKRIGF
jgi:hypothetical protein